MQMAREGVQGQRELVREYSRYSRLAALGLRFAVVGNGMRWVIVSLVEKSIVAGYP